MLARQGWEIVARNFRRVGCELDLAARKGQTLAVVEVKARHAAPASVEEAVGLLSPRKRAALTRGAAALAAERGIDAAVVRFDLAIVVGTRVAYHVQAFEPE